MIMALKQEIIVGLIHSYISPQLFRNHCKNGGDIRILQKLFLNWQKRTEG